MSLIAMAVYLFSHVPAFAGPHDSAEVLASLDWVESACRDSSNNPQSFRILAEGLAHSDPEVKKRAIAVFKIASGGAYNPYDGSGPFGGGRYPYFNNQELVRPLMDLLNDPNVEVALSAGEALDISRKVLSADKLIAVRGDQDVRVRKQIARLAGLAGSDVFAQYMAGVTDPELREISAATLLTNEHPGHIESMASDAERHRQRQSVQALVHAASDSNPKVVQAALYALGASTSDPLGQKATILALVNAHKSGTEEVRQEAAKALSGAEAYSQKDDLLRTFVYAFRSGDKELIEATLYVLAKIPLGVQSTELHGRFHRVSFPGEENPRISHTQPQFTNPYIDDQLKLLLQSGDKEIASLAAEAMHFRQSEIEGRDDLIRTHAVDCARRLGLLTEQ